MFDWAKFLRLTVETGSCLLAAVEEAEMVVAAVVAAQTWGVLGVSHCWGCEGGVEE